MKPKFENIEEELAYEAQNRDYSDSVGIVKAKHQGAHYFTKGQRKGLNVGELRNLYLLLKLMLK